MRIIILLMSWLWIISSMALAASSEQQNEITFSKVTEVRKAVGSAQQMTLFISGEGSVKTSQGVQQIPGLLTLRFDISNPDIRDFLLPTCYQHGMLALSSPTKYQLHVRTLASDPNPSSIINLSDTQITDCALESVIK